MLERNIRELEQKYDCIIPEKRLKVQKVQMRLWEKLDEICKKYNLTYYFFWGALLGAVRHQGFIPWDDDIDVVMPRADYDKLGEIGATEIKDPFFLLSKNTIDNSVYWHMRLIDETTTCIFDSHMDPVQHHQGIAIDIVPLDGVPKSRMSRVIKHIRQISDFLLADRFFRSNSSISFKGRIIKKMGKMYCLNHSGKSRVERTERIKASTPWEESLYLAEGAHYHLFKKTDFEKAMYLDFNGRKAPVPNGYEHILTELYGDYMKLPEKLLRKITDHEAMGFIVDPDVSYYDYDAIMKARKAERAGDVQKTFQRYCKKLDC